jgi:hypothetical protein
MTLSLYNIWLADPATESTKDDIQAQVQQAGLLEEGGSFANRVAVDQIDLVISGQFRLGEALSRKQATELQSLSISGYEGVPLYNVENEDLKRGYYEVAGADVEPAQQQTELAYQYSVALSFTGSHHTHWRAVRTNVESGGTSLSSGTDDLIAVDGQATKTRWFTPSSGTESATVQDTVEGQYGYFDRFDPGEPTFADPILLYEVPFEREPQTDVILYDDRHRPKKVSFVSSDGQQYDTNQYDTASSAGFAEATQWPHVFNVQHEFEGRLVVDTGRLRVRFDEAAGEITAYQWDGGWSVVSIDHTNFDLFDADVEAIGPTDVRVFTEWEKTNGNIDRMVLSFQRGADEAVVRIPENESSIDSDLLELIRPIAWDADDDAQPNQDLIHRDEVK